MKVSELKCEVCGSKFELFHKVLDSNKLRFIRLGYCTKCKYSRAYNVQEVEVHRKITKYSKCGTDMYPWIGIKVKEVAHAEKQILGYQPNQEDKSPI